MIDWYMVAVFIIAIQFLKFVGLIDCIIMLCGQVLLCYWVTKVGGGLKGGEAELQLWQTNLG